MALRGRGEGKGRATQKKISFLELEIENVANKLKGEGSKAFVAQLLKNYFFCGFPKRKG